jgi:signal transduction histidine kinase
MSWLPAVCFAGNRWWLPLSRAAADLIASVLLEQDGVGDDIVAEIADQMRCDPPLAIFAALTQRNVANGVPLPISALASDFTASLSSIFSAGDAYLGVPTDRERFVFQWDDLQASFLRMPQSSWLQSADQWLTVCGPPVPPAIREQWPTLLDETEPVSLHRSASEPFAAVKLDMPLLARKLRRAQTLRSAFGTAIRNAKQASLKQLAYGLSHEINNPLASIHARAQGLLLDENEPSKKKTLQKIVDQTMRAHEMVADLMFYAHPPAPHLGEACLVSLLKQVADQIRPSIAERNIELRVVSPNTPISWIVDQAMMVEAIRALVRNAIEAIGCNGRVELECVARMESGRQIAWLFVRDSGPGLSEEARRYAFDPYFSGREAGRGLGVGLCRVERIATLHGGGVSLLSGPAGCTARLWIPAKA